MDAPAAREVTQVAVRDAEDVDVFRRRPRQLHGGALLQALQGLRRIQVTLEAAPVVVEDVGVVGDERQRAVLDGEDPGDDREAEVLELGAVLPGRVVDDTVDVPLRVQFARREAHVLGALLPGEVEPPRDAGEALRLDGAEHPVPHRQDHVARGQRDGAAGVAEPEHDAKVRHRDVRHLGDEARDAVRLVVAVRLRFRVRARRVHEAHDRQGALGELRDALRGGEVMLGTPDAVLRRAVLGDEADLARLAVEIHAHERRVEGSVAHLRRDLPQRLRMISGAAWRRGSSAPATTASMYESMSMFARASHRLAMSASPSSPRMPACSPAPWSGNREKSWARLSAMRKSWSPAAAACSIGVRRFPARGRPLTLPC